MPRSSSFSVRDILDLPQMKSSSPLSASTPVSGEETLTENGGAVDGSNETAQNDPLSTANDFNNSGNNNSTTATADANRLQQSEFSISIVFQSQLINKSIYID